MTEKNLIGVSLPDRGLMFVDGDKKECDFCDEQKICASLNWIGNNVIIVCNNCLKLFSDAFND